MGGLDTHHLERENSNVVKYKMSDNKTDSMDNNLIYIKLIPKDKLLLALWESAKNTQYMYFCPELVPCLTLAKARRDINYMIQEKRDLELTTYYGKLIFVDITGDYLDPYIYNLYNGKNTAERVVKELKKQELERTILRYFTFF
jgi:hypothetical protein